MKLLAFLGTGHYDETEYTWQGHSAICCYAMVASAQFVDADEAVILATAEAQQAHEQSLRQAMPEKTKTCFVRVPRGEKETELWEIFARVAECVQPGEEIAFDVTHGLRSFPLVGLLAAAFLRSGLNISLKAVLYGAYDVRDQSITPNRTPMFDLTPMLALLEWAAAADRFNRTGDSRYFASLLRRQQKALALQAQGQPERLEQVGNLGTLSGAMTNISQSLALIRPYLAMQQIAQLQEQAEAALPVLAEAEAAYPLHLLLNTIMETYQPLALAEPAADLCQSLLTQRALIAWYAEREHWVQAVSLAREWLVSWIMFQLGMTTLTVLSDRARVEGVVNSEAEEFLTAKKSECAFQSVFLRNIPQVETVLGLWKALTEVRNDIDHAGMRENPQQPQALVSQIRKHIEAIRRLPIRT